MSRKRKAPVRKVYPDPKFHSDVVSKFINSIMYDGKRSTAEKTLYDALDIIKNKNKDLSTYEEGCLSVPDQFAEVDRPATCEVEYLDYYGEKKILKAEGLLATCIQHEMDHLEGILFIDYLSKLKKSMIIKKLSKQKKSSEALVI